MSRKLKFIVLTDTEKTSLEDGYKKGINHLYRRRCEAILMSDAGHTISEIGVHFSVRSEAVSLWLKAWEAEGLSGLPLKKGRGRKPKIALTNTVVIARIENLLMEESRQLKPILVTLEEEYGIKMCKMTLKRLLKKKHIVGSVAEKFVPKSQQIVIKPKK